jgi:hypothetical protein
MFAYVLLTLEIDAWLEERRGRQDEGASTAEARIEPYFAPPAPEADRGGHRGP